MIQVETIPVEMIQIDMSQVEPPGPTRRPARDDDDDDLPCLMSPPPLPFPRVFPGL